MMTIDENDVRQMLHRHAADVTPSDDAWEQIQAKIREEERPVAVVRRHPFRVMAGGAAAAAVAALVAGQVLTSPTTQVATPTTETTVPAPGIDPPDFPYVFPEPASSEVAALDPVKSAKHFLEARTGLVPGEPRVLDKSPDSYHLRFDEGPVFSEVFLRRDGRRWWVDSATSDLLQLQPGYVSGEIVGDGGVEADGTLTLRYRGGDGDPSTTEERQVRRLDLIDYRQPMAGEAYVVIGGVLAMDDGTFAVVETWVQSPNGGAVGPDVSEDPSSYLGIYPAYTGEELAGYEDMAAEGDTTYTDPRATAGAFLGDHFFRRDESEVSYSVGELQQGDNLSGEVPFTLSDGGEGIVAVRKASPDARTWYVVFAATVPQSFDVRVEGNGTTVEPAAGVTVTTAEMQPMPGGDLVTGEPADGLVRFEGVIEGIVKLVGTGADGRTVVLMSRVAAAD